MTAAARPSGRIGERSEAMEGGDPAGGAGGKVSRGTGERLEGGLAAGLAIAARSNALSFIAVPAPGASAAAIVEAFPHEPRVAWTSSELTLVGIGSARELRASGEQRWTDLVRAASELAIAGAVIGGEPAALAALGDAQPRFLGGAAFAPGAADRAPWQGFGDAWFVLPRWTYVATGAGAQLVLAVDAADAAAARRWHDELAALHAAFAVRVSRAQPAIVELARASAAEWRDQVVGITEAIANGTCSKIVAARTLRLALAGPVRPAGLLAALEARHPDCVRVLIQPPHAGALVAATPERLVRRDGDQVWCDALAGTRSIAAPGGAALDQIATASAELIASAKDRREHALVVEAIRAALTASPGVAAVEAPDEPDVRTLRHVVHLHTPFHARLSEPLHVLELAARLHPTPAVGGTPRDVASNWIRLHEPVARGWYAAPVGWFDLDGNGELAVAIRSGVLAGNRVHLWAGAGIVAGSDPDRELAETELKLRAMLGALDAGDAGGAGDEETR